MSNLPTYRREDLPPDQVTWFTRGNKTLAVAALHWPGGVSTLLVYRKDAGLTRALLERHYRTHVAPLIRERLWVAQPMDGLQ